ncbi:MAG: hypothetical protein LPK85_10585 [Gammaproteobacteria bacterium]|nr:hypothetical protein [Gammaproteobacteria bacterium]
MIDRLKAKFGNAMNRELLQDTQCLFGGGTAIALQLDEFRLSRGILDLAVMIRHWGDISVDAPAQAY